MSSALQLDRRLRWSLYAAFALLFATGAAWLLADQLKDSADGEFWQATIANVLMVHGGVAMLTLLLLGALFPIHIARAWRGRLNRVSGSIMVICNAVLILTAFARRGSNRFYRSNSGSLAMLAAMRRAWSRVSSLAVARLPGSFSQ
jgi:cytochrome c biogenesis protein CcdA